MKKHCILLLIIIFVSSVYSQKVIHKNSYNISGGLAVSLSEKDHPEFKSNSKSLIFNPAVSFHIMDVLTVGGSVLYDYSEETIENESGSNKSISRIFSFGPKVRYYFHDENYAPFVDFGINYSRVLPSKTEGLSYSLGTGINYFFTKSIALEPTISYTASTYSNPDYNTKTFRVGIGLNYHIND